MPAIIQYETVYGAPVPVPINDNSTSTDEVWSANKSSTETTAIKNKLQWKLLGNTAGTEEINYPSEFEELHVILNYGKFNVYETVNMLKDVLTTTRIVQRGNSAKTGFEIIFNTNSLKLNWAYIEGTNTTSIASMSIFYR